LIDQYEKTPLDQVLTARIATGLGGHWYGVYPALVSDIKDPDGGGRQYDHDWGHNLYLPNG
jgi:hypothetical protein